MRVVSPYVPLHCPSRAVCPCGTTSLRGEMSLVPTLVEFRGCFFVCAPRLACHRLTCLCFFKFLHWSESMAAFKVGELANCDKKENK